MSELMRQMRAGIDVSAITLLVLGGAAGVAQLALSWTSVAPSVGLPVEGGVTGWNIFRSAQAGASFSFGAAFAAYSVVGMAAAGMLLMVTALAVAAGADPRVTGGIAAILGPAMLVAAAGWAIRAHSLLGRSLGQVFVEAGAGWYLFLVAGPISTLAAARILLARRSVTTGS